MPPYATLVITKFAFCKFIGIVLVFSTPTLKQQPRGIVIKAVEVILKYESTTVGVTIALLVKIGSPEIEIAIEIGPAVSSVGTAIFPLK